jgi:hypothetical protein
VRSKRNEECWREFAGVCIVEAMSKRGDERKQETKSESRIKGKVEEGAVRRETETRRGRRRR